MYLDNEFIPGQRWVNHAELQLGLGTVLTIEHRTVSLLFTATGESRTYSRLSAPLSRVSYKPGDKIKNRNGNEIVIQQINKDDDGLYCYQGTDENNENFVIHEIDIDATIALNGPAERLLAGLVDDSKWFHLRHLALSALDFIYHQPVSTITGCRVDIIAHQLYIASEVSKRYAPRVLLADEVGLGKTIEAGLIIHQQLYAEQIRRVLIVVPDNLLHQWLVEMLRRFNLRFSLFDSERHMDSTDPEYTENPFQEEQLVLCGLNTLTQNKAFYNDILSASWDMLVVDEAHHLEWTPENSSQSYLAIEKLASSTPAVLLLTATPEQLGKAGHFARLRILDPDRYHDFNSFIEEEKNYAPVASALKCLFEKSGQANDIIKKLELALKVDLSRFTSELNDEKNLSEEHRYTLIRHLLDLHGTGRVLFRNTRSGIPGFPDRQLFAYPLAMPEAYQTLQSKDEDNSQNLASIELCYQQHNQPSDKHWIQIDPRVEWLIEQYGKLKPEKMLVITHDRQTVIDLVEYLKSRHGIYAAMFHEMMTILERDRAAEYFADPESGTRIMICSEIGSEGRNFQFAHHLILFDLPMLPDLLEQRIGRLDRIGQKYTVKIHVPYIESSAQEHLFKWYRDGLSAFSSPCQTGQKILQEFQAQLVEILQKKNDNVEDFISVTRDKNQQLIKELENGRDRLLEFNSCPPLESNELKSQALNVENESLLGSFMESAFDCFGIDSEENNEHSLILRPSEDMVTTFPHLPDDGMTITYERNTALIHENWHYLSWTHPMVTGALDLALSYEKGNATAVSFNTDIIDPGTLLLECNFILQISADQDFLLRNLIAPQVVRVVISEDGTHYQNLVSHHEIESNKSFIDIATIRKIVLMKQESIRNIIEIARAATLDIAPVIIEKSRGDTSRQIQSDLKRLEELAKINTNIRQIEIDFLKSQSRKVESVFDSIIPRLDAIRLLIST